MDKITHKHQDHRERAAARLSREGRKYFKYIEFDPDEELITEIRKHPIGLIIVLSIGAFVIFALLGIAIVVSSVDFTSLLGSSFNNAKPIIIFISFLFIIGAAVMTAIAAFLYISNVIFVTTEKLAQVLYLSLFNRKISQLSIGDVQDVTVTQKGILAHIFNYGTLVIETAGEQQNYTFTYVPDPYQVSQVIVGSHERNLTKYGN